MSDDKLRLVLCWHMHQPEYRDRATGRFMLPWTYLHTIKDYADMAAHLEAQPGAKAVVNFAPILLEQIDDYATQVGRFLTERATISDPLLAALGNPSVAVDLSERLKLINSCKRANRERQINRYPVFSQLIDMASWVESQGNAVSYVNEQFFADLLVWYHLVWLGETIQLHDRRAQRLIEKAGQFTLDDRLILLEIVHDQLKGVIGRYKALAAAGKIELSVTPYAHPIMPLLLDLQSAREALPDLALPELKVYPGGENRVKWQLRKGIATFQHFFGFTPSGCWPSEGSVSARTMEILAEFGFAWAASGGSVLHNSLRAQGMDENDVHHPFKVESSNTACFFRDDGLSDLIGFEYSKWHADDAVADLLHHLENIADQAKENSVVSIIMDGENAWEYFPQNGYHFLSALYRRLAEHPTIELTTFSELLAAGDLEVKSLSRLVAGSWVYGTFSTWIGSADKNKGWDMLGDVKRAFDKAISDGKLNEQRIAAAEIQLAVCEGSDWFWWFGDYNPGAAVSDFEKQYRMNLANLYLLLDEQAPAYLDLSFTQGSGAPALGGTMRRGNEN